MVAGFGADGVVERGGVGANVARENAGNLLIFMRDSSSGPGRAFRYRHLVSTLARSQAEGDTMPKNRHQ